MNNQKGHPWYQEPNQHLEMKPCYLCIRTKTIGDPPICQACREQHLTPTVEGEKTE